MTKNEILLLPAAIVFFIAFAFAQKKDSTQNDFICYIADPQKQSIQFYWKDDKQQIFKSILNLKIWLQNNGIKLVFAMNGGMYKKNNSPQGLFIENGKNLVF